MSNRINHVIAALCHGINDILTILSDGSYHLVIVSVGGINGLGNNILNTCKELIRCLPQLQYAKTGDPSDAAKEPHEITHAPDALRYMMDGRPRAGEKPVEQRGFNRKPIQQQTKSILSYGGRR